MIKFRFLFTIIFAITAGLLVAVIVMAWTNPTANPPSGGAALNYLNGNVGIGTTLPNALLSVSGGALSFPVNMSSGYVGYSVFQESSKLTIAGGTSGIQFNNNANNAALVNILNTGNVGIGTATPVDKLHVVGTILTSGAMVTPTANSIALSQETGYSRLIAFGPNTSTKGNWRMYVSSSDGSIQTLSMSGDTAGNVGIGTAGPTSRLTLEGTAADTNTFMIDIKRVDQPEIGGGIRWRDNTGTIKWTFTGEGGATPGIYLKEGASNHFVVRNSGNVGIGTATPAWKLDVVGGSMRADGYVAGGQLCIGSDCRASWPVGGSGFTGGGTTNYVPKWTSGTSLGNSTIFDDGTTVTMNSYNVRGATYSFGGMYAFNAAVCHTPNYYTGGCSCPTDFIATRVAGVVDDDNWGVQTNLFWCGK